jgi:ketosteroid isomerase-like protein
MKRFLLIPLFVSSLAMAQEPDSSSAIFQLREAERSFAKASVMYGRQEAFARFLKTESFLFTDHWISNGKELWEGRKPTPSVLKWEPELMMISESHDFGISTGPWELQEYRPGTAPLATGYFLSVWKKENGEWKVALDAGISTPSSAVQLKQFRFIPESTVNNPAPKVIDNQKLIDIDNQYLNQWKERQQSYVYMSNHSEQSFMLFNGHMPSESRDSIMKWISSFGKELSWTPYTSGMAGTGDLGFTCGSLIGVNGKSGSYVRIWRKSGENWEIVVEMLNP